MVSQVSQTVSSLRRMVRRSWLWRMLRTRLGLRLSRYGVASLVALGVSEAVYLILYVGLTIPLAGILAGVVGGIPKFVLCRWWAWELRGKENLTTEIVSYVLVASATGLVSGTLTRTIDGLIISSVAQGATRTFLVGLAFLVSNGLVFLVKFVLFDKLVFTGRRGPRRQQPEPAEL